MFVDTDEREFFANGEHELLITQTQHQPMSASDTSIDLTYFNHPVKAIHIAAGNDSGPIVGKFQGLHHTSSQTRLCLLTVFHSLKI